MDYRIFQRQSETRLKLPMQWGSGMPAARVVLLGFKPDAGEEIPFTVGSNLYLRHVLGSMAVPHQFVYFSYLVKHPDGESFELMESWSGISQTEIKDFLKPKAVILFGLEVFNAMFDEQETNIEVLRRVRFAVDSVPDVNFFVTYSPHEVMKSDDGGDTGKVVAWRSDLSAVFNVTPKHFMKMRVINATGT